MNKSGQADKDTIPCFEEIPETLVLKQKLSESIACEIWEGFDRSKKKKVNVCRYKVGHCGDDSTFERFQDDLNKSNQIFSEFDDWPLVLGLGKDAEGIWYFREVPPCKSLLETISQGKVLKEHDAARRFVVLTGVLLALHQKGLFHRNLQPKNLFFPKPDVALFIEPDIGHFLDPAVVGENYTPSIWGDIAFLAPEQQAGTTVTEPLDARTDIWSLAACLVFALTGRTPAELKAEEISGPFESIILSSMKEDRADRLASLSELRTDLERIAKETRPSAFNSPINPSTASPTAAPVSVATSPDPDSSEVRTPQPVATVAPASPPSESMPPGTVCPQCKTPLRLPSERICHHCGRSFYEPCLNCQSTNPFWLRVCRGCGTDLLALKQKMFATLNSQKQQILKLRESYGHDKTLPLLKYMSTVNHPDFVAFREWAKSMTALIHKERRDIKAYVDNIRVQANAAMEAQKYERVQQILEQVPRPLLDEELRKQYVEAGEILTEVDSLIREIRNAITTKQYSQLLSCVQRYSELKANDPEARNLQQKIEKLTTMTSAKGMKLRRIPPGRFYMGSHDTDEFLRNNEHPQHRVQITKSLFVGVYAVTQAEFTELMEFNPSTSVDSETNPVDSVSWFSALEFCNKMSEVEEVPPYYDLSKVKRRSNGSIESADVKINGGDGYRLLTEAEWEYVCRAGSITPWCFGDQVMEVGESAWYYDNSSMESHPVGEKKPNAWGLFDMHGNIMEWCQDWYGEFYYEQCPDETEDPEGPKDGTARVLRGGAWQFGAEATRSAYRNSSTPDAASSVIGFRVCRNAGDDVM